MNRCGEERGCVAGKKGTSWKALAQGANAATVALCWAPYSKRKREPKTFFRNPTSNSRWACGPRKGSHRPSHTVKTRDAALEAGLFSLSRALLAGN